MVTQGTFFAGHHSILPWRFQSNWERLSRNEKTTTLGSLWEGGEKSGWNCSRRKEGAHREERFSIFNWVVGVGFIVKQRLSEDLKEVWEYEETSVAGAEWVKKRAAVQGLRADRY